MLSQATIDSFQNDGIAFIPGLFKAHLDSLRMGVQKNIEEPGPYAAENLNEGEIGRFFDDYCNWQRINEFRNAAFDKNIAKAAALLMQSKTVQLFHDHVLVKAAGTLKPQYLLVKRSPQDVVLSANFLSNGCTIIQTHILFHRFFN